MSIYLTIPQLNPKGVFRTVSKIKNGASLEKILNGLQKLLSQKTSNVDVL